MKGPRRKCQTNRSGTEIVYGVAPLCRVVPLKYLYMLHGVWRTCLVPRYPMLFVLLRARTWQTPQSTSGSEFFDISKRSQKGVKFDLQGPLSSTFEGERRKKKLRINKSLIFLSFNFFLNRTPREQTRRNKMNCSISFLWKIINGGFQINWRTNGKTFFVYPGARNWPASIRSNPYEITSPDTVLGPLILGLRNPR